VLAPDDAPCRLLALDDATARGLYRPLVWAVRALGIQVLALAVNKVLFAPAVLTIACNIVFAVTVAALLLRLLTASQLVQRDHVVVLPQWLWLRFIGWLVLLIMAVALVIGYAGLAAFLAERMITTASVFGALYLLLGLVNSFFAQIATVETQRGRDIAATIGVNPRRLGLIATGLSGGCSLLLMLAALILLIGPWEVNAADLIDALRNATFVLHVGEFSISLTSIVTGVAVLIISLLVTRVLQGWVEHRFLPQTELEPSLQQSIATIFGYVGVITAIVLAMSQIGIDLQKVALIAGALSVGIGFGLQSIVSNFVSGLILLAERPIRVGDLVVVKGEEGYVRRIRVRATEIETAERASVIVPNAEFITSVVKNWTHANLTGRIIVRVGVSYTNDPNVVRDIMQTCAEEHPDILRVPPARALLLEFGESALVFELRAFVREVDRSLLVRSDLGFAILRRFRDAGIEISVPQRELRVRGGGTILPTETS
jgi:potassium efflux system protein